MKEEAFDALVRDIGFGIIVGVVAVLALVIVAARGDRRPDDRREKKDETNPPDGPTAP